MIVFLIVWLVILTWFVVDINRDMSTVLGIVERMHTIVGKLISTEPEE